MKPEYLFLIIFILLILIIYVAIAKGEKKKLTLINSNGESVYVQAEMADNGSTKFKGLMGRESIGQDEGMLFTFDEEGIHSFWMFNTTIPLDAIFFDSKGSVVDVIQMAPCGLNITKCRFYTPKKPAKYVLEVNMGFSGNHSIIPGKSRLELS
jgi:uncharacterized membrane protein (UPF0127 family)